MWISGGEQTGLSLNQQFLRTVLKEVIRKVLVSLMEWLVEERHVKMENYFVDGTKVSQIGSPLSPFESHPPLSVDHEGVVTASRRSFE